MASTTTTTTSAAATYPSDPLSPTTTFIQADPSTFRSIVQKLTGISQTPPPQTHQFPFPSKPTTKLPTAAAGEIGPRKPAFKLHERRQRKLEIQLKDSIFTRNNFVGFGGDMVMESPDSPFDLFSFGSPKTPLFCEDDEDKAIARKGFYLHPSQLSCSRGLQPELLPLFPLHSPIDHDNNN